MDIRESIVPYAAKTNIVPSRANNDKRNAQTQNVEFTRKFKAGTAIQASARAMIPAGVAAKLTHISNMYAFPIDVGNMSLEEATPENLKALRKVADMVSNNSKLLPEFMKLVSQVLNADLKLADFHKNVTKAALKHQEKLDQETAEIFLAMARYGAKATKLEHRTNVRNELVERRTAAYEEHYETSVYGNEARIIDVEYQVAASNNKLMAESKTKRINYKKDRKEKLQAFIDSAYSV
ncbi:MAG: hypothetical protein KME46_32650 [Brasilonema angustatum HA4187-MV1]|jgi:hypothetical protein|nr:hypothetical protein [Brasilonema angustatum HA4187-MV1]